MLAAPIDWCPNPNSTICLRVKGNSMSPLILDGYLIAVDTLDVQIVSRLIRFDHTDVLVSDRREYESISLAPESKWRIIGKVLWWTGRARYR